MRRATPVWGLDSLILVVALAVSNLLFWQRLNQPVITPQSGGMRIVMLAGTEAAPGATGTIVISAAGELATLVVDGLPSLDEAHPYQLWLIRFRYPLDTLL
jgi:hypothetical protein